MSAPGNAAQPGGVDAKRTGQGLNTAGTPAAPEARWSALREWLEFLLDSCRRDADAAAGHSASDWLEGRGAAYAATLKRMRELEAGQ